MDYLSWSEAEGRASITWGSPHEFLLLLSLSSPSLSLSLSSEKSSHKTKELYGKKPRSFRGKIWCVRGILWVMSLSYLRLAKVSIHIREAESETERGVWVRASISNLFVSKSCFKIRAIGEKDNLVLLLNQTPSRQIFYYFILVHIWKSPSSLFFFF